jgi:hypothetical protein
LPAFDDWPPFLDLGFLKTGQGLWRLLVARPDVLAEIGKTLFHRGVS